MAKDPVCGMVVDEATEFKASYKGKEYYFCCSACLEQFKARPEKFAK